MGHIRSFALTFACLSIVTTAPRDAAQQQGATATSAVPSDGEIHRLLVERVDTDRQSVGIVVGIIGPNGRRIVSYGRRAVGDTAPLDGDTVFEIGSVTKVFTAVLLAEAVRRGEVSLTDPVSKYLPPEVTMPTRGGRAITLVDLATHTSGLPRLPTNFEPADVANPYADYSVARMYAFLTSLELTRDIGASFEYSNLGVGLLGHALARRAGTDYETLMRARIAEPLGMKSTAITLSPDLRTRLARGHNGQLEPTANWDIPTFAGAGALRASANDLLTFLAAVMGYTPTPLDAAFAATLAVRRPAPPHETALGWQIFKGYGTEVVWHNGGTGGYRSWLGYEPRSRTGVVVLMNAGTQTGGDDLGRHLLAPASPLVTQFPERAAARAARTEVRVDPAVFDRFVGRYQLAPAAIMTITREGPRFFVQLTGQPRFEIFAERETSYFLKVVDAQLTFEVDPQGRTSALVLHQNGADQRATRIEGEAVVPTVIEVNPAVLERYVGRYQLAPNVFFSITREGARLFAQLTGQPTFEVFPTSERDFFYKVVNARLTFEAGADGPATAVVLHQNGRSPRAPRVD